MSDYIEEQAANALSTLCRNICRQARMQTMLRGWAFLLILDDKLDLWTKIERIFLDNIEEFDDLFWGPLHGAFWDSYRYMKRQILALDTTHATALLGNNFELFDAIKAKNETRIARYHDIQAAVHNAAMESLKAKMKS